MEPDEVRLTQPEIRAMLRDVKADLRDLTETERWLTDQLNGTRRTRVALADLRAWAQSRHGRFTARQAAAAHDCSVGQARKKLRELAAAGTLVRIISDTQTEPEAFEFAKPEPADAPRRRPRGGEPVPTYAADAAARVPVPGTGGGSSKGRPTNDKTSNEAILAAVARGWSVEDRGTQALTLHGPEGQRVTVHKTPGRGRAQRNLRAAIRRAERDGRFARPLEREPAPV